MEFVAIAEILLKSRFCFAGADTFKLNRSSTVSVVVQLRPGQEFSTVTVEEVVPGSSNIITHAGKANGNRYFECGALIGMALKMLEVTSSETQELPSCQDRCAMLPMYLTSYLFSSFARGYASVVSTQIIKQAFSSSACTGMRAGLEVYTTTVVDGAVRVNGNGRNIVVPVPASITFAPVQVGRDLVYVWSKTGLERVDRVLAAVSQALATACHTTVASKNSRLLLALQQT